MLAPSDDERLLIAELGSAAERARVVVRLLAVLDVDESVRRPQSLEGVRNRREALPRLGGDAVDGVIGVLHGRA